MNYLPVALSYAEELRLLGPGCYSTRGKTCFELWQADPASRQTRMTYGEWAAWMASLGITFRYGQLDTRAAPEELKEPPREPC